MAAKEILVPLLALIEPWSDHSGIPRATVLRRLCEWAVCSGFPEGSFRDAYDQQINGFDIYMSHKSILESRAFSNSVSLGTSTISNPAWGPHLLERVLLPAQCLEAFCDKTDTEPYWDRRTGILQFFKKRRVYAHLCPPPCPTAEHEAIRFDAARSVDANFNGMKRLMDRLQGNDHHWNRSLKNIEGYSAEQSRGMAFDMAGWKELWDFQYGLAVHNLELAPDAHKTRLLEKMKADWVAACTEKEAAAVPDAAPAIELTLFVQEQNARLQGITFPIPEVQFRLLLCLAEAATRNTHAEMRAIEHSIWGEQLSKLKRQVGDVVRDLRSTVKAAVTDEYSDTLIVSVPRQGYRLDLAPHQIVIERQRLKAT